MKASVSDIQNLLHDSARLHMMGVGGAGMRGLARILSNEGHHVTGCDTKSEKAHDIQKKYGIETYTGHDPAHLNPTERGPLDLLIHSAAVPDSTAERQKALKMELPQASYSRGLAALFNNSKGIAVAGTHGKTTCTAMLSVVLEASGFDPSCLVGGIVQEWETSSRVGDGPHFVAEACEFGENFEAMCPRHILLTNVDRAHLDYYDHAGAVEDAFARFLSRQEALGFLVCENNSKAVSRVCKHAVANVQRISRDNESDWWLRSEQQSDHRTFTVQSNGDKSPHLPVPIRGKHQVMNAAQVAVLARLLGAEWEHIRDGLEAFSGVHRRFEVHRDGSEGGPVVIDDYGHHPEEIQRTIAAVQESYPERHVVVCFQPHQYSRTYHFRDEWAGALSAADEIWLTPIYEARDSEQQQERISIQDLAENVREIHDQLVTVSGPARAGERMARQADEKHVFLTIGAGDIWKAVEQFREDFTSGISDRT